MSTRSAIIRKTEAGYEGVYCHFDGYPGSVGQKLLDYYNDADWTAQLIALGALSSLGERIEPTGPHSFDKPEKGTTVAYHRDRGEAKWGPIPGATIAEVASQIGHNGYVYVFDIDNGWKVNGIPLADAVADESNVYEACPAEWRQQRAA